MKKVKKTIFFLISIFIIFIIFVKFDSIRSFAKNHLPPGVKIFVTELFFGKRYIEEVSFFKTTNYQQKVLPETQFENLKFTKIIIKGATSATSSHYKLVNVKSADIKKIFIEVIEEDLMIVGAKGEVKLVKNLDVKNSKVLTTNLDKFKIHEILDIAIIKKDLFISFSYKINQVDACSFFYLVRAPLKKDNLIFENFYKGKKCSKDTYGGRIASFNFNNKDGFLLTMSAQEEWKHLAQDANSPYGKILFFDLNNSKPIIISKGHRNPQGLFVDGKTILATEHGPYGGDEINKIILNGNYGWPHSSYGDVYNFRKILKTRTDYVYEKNHAKFNFVEPIYSFVPSIGISEIIKVPKDFSKYWQNNYLVSSLNGRSLYRILFDNNFSKLIFSEKIPIGERIRDIKYIPKINSFVLSLEESGSLGLLTVSK